MKITKLGHCCLIIEVEGIRFLTDPGNYTTAQNDIKNIHAVVISHEHTDHLHIESLKKVLENNPNAQVICNGSVGALLDNEKIEYTKVSDGESIEIQGVSLSGHGLKHQLIFREYEQVENTGYFFANKLFYPGDALHNPGFPIDILAFPVAGPWCTISDALEYVLDVKPKKAFTVHDGNLLRTTGITTRLPALKLPEANIEFIALELGREYDL